MSAKVRGEGEKKAPKCKYRPKHWFKVLSLILFIVILDCLYYTIIPDHLYHIICADKPRSTWYKENLTAENMGKEKSRKRRKSKVTSSDSSSSSSSNSSREKKKLRKLKKKLKKEQKKTEKILKKKLREEKRKLKKRRSKSTSVSRDETNKVTELAASDIPIELMEKSKAMAPMTKEEWEKRQSVIRKVLDEETGRYRLIKGDGEVLEEIVSRDRHRQINKQATQADGDFFQSRTVNKKHT